MSADWGPGTVILGRYRLESILGRGGMGSVWRAEHLQLRSPVAVKLLDRAIANDEHMLQRFMREAQSAASLRSPHVVQIFDYGVEAGTAFIAMELLQGESLADRIARVKQLPSEEVIRFLSQVLRAISKAHDGGIVHRDLKPDNIFICKDDPEFAKVLDFGVAKVKTNDLSGSAGSRTQTGMMIGTPYYMSPEQTQAKDVDARADLWAVAVIAYESLVGRRPFIGDSFGELVLGICTKPVPVPSEHALVPPGFDEWFVKGTQRDRDRRFGSAREMAEELLKLAGSAGTARSTQTGISTPPKAPNLSRSSPKVEGLDLTTGQHAVTAGSVNASRPGRNPAVYVLIAAALLIVGGVGVFVASGGASAFNKNGLNPGAAAAVLTPPVTSVAVPAREPAAPAITPALLVAPEPTPLASAAGVPLASAVPPGSLPSAGVLPAAPKSVVNKPAAAKPEPLSKRAPVSAAPQAKDPLPPKNWEF